MNFRKYILKRLILMIPTMFGITLLSFALLNFVPGGPIDQHIQKIRFGGNAHSRSGSLTNTGVSLEVMEALKKQYGFDKPLYSRYFIWLKKLTRLDFGNSFVYGRPAMQVIGERFDVSLQFGIISLFLSYLFAIVLGVAMAWKKNESLDSFLSTILIAISSVPSFMWAVLLLLFFASGSFLGLFPLGYLTSENYSTLSWSEKLFDRIHHFILPLVCYVMGAFTALSLLCRNILIDELSKDYIRTARAYGASKKDIYLKYSLRNALIPIVTGLGGMFALFLGGSLIVESTFQLDGLGKLGYEALLTRDYNLVMALILIFSLIVLFGNLASDILYRWVDPRIDFNAGST
jgi:microcin C transport system permease protein